MASSGPFPFGTFADDSSVGTITLSNPSRANVQGSADGGVSQGNFGAAPTITHYLKTTNAGFAIDSGATITGVKYEVMAYATGDPGEVLDSTIKLVKGGTVSGNSLAVGANLPNVTGTWQSYGGDGEMWGVALTPADVNASTFGAVSSWRQTNSASRAIILDATRITVYYTTAAAATATNGRRRAAAVMMMRRRRNRRR